VIDDRRPELGHLLDLDPLERRPGHRRRARDRTPALLRIGRRLTFFRRLLVSGVG
jgi:hypothetical protein